ncbi:alcohol dehydrogenase [Kockovaella imperatae]|uniref:Alcohol dehydrogenase n=1 Tax=Kockovaella imperatae TaxID=4999 RepID=A0A1Y1UH01_9TREE|nr:alcohol dehydrogenase [Kockovaella imperatae]ORX36776.1 alcohol dehydrogenase [Kockovaella imperatae]
MPASRASVVRLLSATTHQGCRGCGRTHGSAHRSLATPADMPIGMPPGKSEYAFEMAASNLRFGVGATNEVGMDLANMINSLPPSERHNAKIGVFTDKNVAHLAVMQKVEASLKREGLDWQLFDKVSVEPTDDSWRNAIDWTRNSNITHFLAVGGGSVMDTAKAANLFANYPEADLMDFINAPIGKGRPIDKKLSPIIAIPTTAGTGSETTGTAILDIKAKKFKTGIASRALKPTLGIVDLDNTATCPKHVAISAGLDVLFHSLESWTAIPYSERSPRPANPLLRPAYQGSNPISDIFSFWALKQTVKYLPRIARDPGDVEARQQMLLAASSAGIGFGNAGVHMPHAFSYPISSLNKARAKERQYMHPSYDPNVALIPHGVAVSLTAPAVFEFTAPASPQRHREAAAVFMGDRAGELDRVRDEDIGRVLGEEVRRFLDLVEVPRGLQGVGYLNEDISSLVQGALPQRRVLDLAPLLSSETAEQVEQLTGIIENSMKW